MQTFTKPKDLEYHTYTFITSLDRNYNMKTFTKSGDSVYLMKTPTTTIDLVYHESLYGTYHIENFLVIMNVLFGSRQNRSRSFVVTTIFSNTTESNLNESFSFLI